MPWPRKIGIELLTATALPPTVESEKLQAALRSMSAFRRGDQQDRGSASWQTPRQSYTSQVKEVNSNLGSGIAISPSEGTKGYLGVCKCGNCPPRRLRFVNFYACNIKVPGVRSIRFLDALPRILEFREGSTGVSMREPGTKLTVFFTPLLISMNPLSSLRSHERSTRAFDSLPWGWNRRLYV